MRRLPARGDTQRVATIESSEDEAELHVEIDATGPVIHFEGALPNSGQVQQPLAAHPSHIVYEGRSSVPSRSTANQPTFGAHIDI